MREASERLREVVRLAEPKLRGITEDAAGKPVLKGGWSPKQTVGHLIDSAANNHQRFVRTTLHGPYEGPGYAQDDWVNLEDYQRQKWSDILVLWSAYNRHLAHILTQIPDDKAGVPCKIGTSEYTLGFVVNDYVDHMLGHLKQLGVA